jgi:hypothetical protein
MTEEELAFFVKSCGSSTTAATEVSKRIYQLANQLVEALERAGLLGSNGHHMALMLAEYAKQQVSLHWRGK